MAARNTVKYCNIWQMAPFFKPCFFSGAGLVYWHQAQWLLTFLLYIHQPCLWQNVLIAGQYAC
jgi:hypothetical protein